MDLADQNKGVRVVKKDQNFPFNHWVSAITNVFSAAESSDSLQVNLPDRRVFVERTAGWAAWATVPCAQHHRPGKLQSCPHALGPLTACAPAAARVNIDRHSLLSGRLGETRLTR